MFVLLKPKIKKKRPGNTTTTFIFQTWTLPDLQMMYLKDENRKLDRSGHPKIKADLPKRINLLMSITRRFKSTSYEILGIGWHTYLPRRPQTGIKMETQIFQWKHGVRYLPNRQTSVRNMCEDLDEIVTCRESESVYRMIRMVTTIVHRN